MRLEEIGEEHEAAFLTMLKDFAENDPDGFAYFFGNSGHDWSSARFKKFVRECERDRMDWRPKAGKVSVSRYILRDEKGGIVACARMRFPLDEISEVDGGNLEVAVPPSCRRQGNGAFALSLLLFEAVRAGLSRALCTCPAADRAARTMIEKNRGKLMDEVQSPGRAFAIARYWISFRGH